MPIFDDGASAGLYGWCSTTASAPSASDAGPAAPPHAPTAIAARANITTPRTKTNLRPIPTSPAPLAIEHRGRATTMSILRRWRRGGPRAHRLRRRPAPRAIRRRHRGADGADGDGPRPAPGLGLGEARPAVVEGGLGPRGCARPVAGVGGRPDARVPGRGGRTGGRVPGARGVVVVAGGGGRTGEREARPPSRGPVAVRVHRRRIPGVRPCRRTGRPRGRVPAGRRLGAAQRGAVRAR